MGRTPHQLGHWRLRESQHSDGTRLGELPARPLAPPIAEFKRIPESHNGSDQFTFKVEFTTEVSLISETLEDYAFNVTNGSIEKAERDEQGSNMNLDHHGETGFPGRLRNPATRHEKLRQESRHLHQRRQKLFNTTEFTVRGPSTP